MPHPPLPTRARTISSYRGLHLVSVRPMHEAIATSNLLYRIAAVGAALFLVVTIF
jgi:hypothetical protein